ncbi:MAG: response regulator [Sneathiella sp.]
MYDRRYQSASALLYDPQSAMRYNTRIALLNIGFGAVEAVNDYSEFIERMEEGRYDLVIGDSRSDSGDTCEMVRKIRQNGIGKNPFVTVIVTLWDTAPEQVNTTIEAGADDLIMRPMSSLNLRDRVVGLVHSRKPFIVTGDYVGPERRQIVRGLTRVSPMIVPNSLQAKVESRPEFDATPENIEAALRAVNDRKITIYTEKFLRSSSRILSLATDLTQIDERQALVRDMQSMNRDLEKRIEGTEFEHVLSLCDALDGVLARIAGSAADLKEQEKELLLQIPFAVHKACQELRQSADLAFDIQDISSQVKTAHQ